MNKKLITTLCLITATLAIAANAKKTTSRGFPLHDVTSAPAATKEITEGYQEKFKMVPHLVGLMAESPALMLSYRATQDNLVEHGTLTPAQNNIVQMAIARENECFY